jgi:hypothetical protein
MMCPSFQAFGLRNDLLGPLGRQAFAVTMMSAITEAQRAEEIRAKGASERRTLVASRTRQSEARRAGKASVPNVTFVNL